MIIDAGKAQRFIDSYMSITLALINQDEVVKESHTLIATGRQRLRDDPDVLDEIVKARTQSGHPPDPQVVEAVATLRVQNWIYLRDTRHYSIFLDTELEAAYAVYGLTERLRDVVGDSGAIIETGLIEYDGKFVCDGIITMVVWLGVDYRRDLGRELDRLKREGRFYRYPEPPGVAAPARAGKPALRIARASRRR